MLLGCKVGCDTAEGDITGYNVDNGGVGCTVGDTKKYKEISIEKKCYDSFRHGRNFLSRDVKRYSTIKLH